MTATVRQIANDALDIIGEVGGPGTQVYDDDRTMRNVVRSFNLIFKKYQGFQYCEWFRVQLDGVNGFAPINTFIKVRDFEDFISVHHDAKQVKLPRLPKHINPYTLTGTQLQYWTSLAATNANFAARRLQFYPITSTAFVNVYARVYPIDEGKDWSWTDTIYLDRDMLAYGAAYMALVGDDLNSNAAEASKTLMEVRYRDIIAGLNSEPIAMTRDSNIPTEWSTAP